MGSAQVDELDFGILRELLVGNQPRARPDRVSLQAMATRLGVHVNTVAARMTRLEEQQLFLPLTLEAMPPLGIHYASYFFPLVHGLSQATREALCGVPGLSVFPEYVDGALLILFGPTRAAIERDLHQAEKILHPARPELETSSWDDWSDVEPFPLKRHDIGIVARLVRDPRVPLSRIAAELGVTTRTIELRLQALRKAHAIAMMVGGSASPEGMVMGHFIADVPEGRDQKRIAAEILALCPNAFYRSVMRPRVSVAVYARSTAALLDQAERFRQVAGIERPKTRILVRWTVNPRFAASLATMLGEVHHGTGVDARDERSKPQVGSAT